MAGVTTRLPRRRPADDGPADQQAPADERWQVRDPGWDDLARTRPGSAAQARARDLRREHPLLAAAEVLGLRTEARAFAAGARGERAVGRRLNRWGARRGWHVLHAVPVGQRGTDIDHVVIGPFGVVTVNTKATTTSVWVGEHAILIGATKVDYLRKSRAEARRGAGPAQPRDGLGGPGPAGDRLRRRSPVHRAPGRPARCCGAQVAAGLAPLALSPARRPRPRSGRCPLRRCPPARRLAAPPAP